MGKIELFLELAKPDSQGKSGKIYAYQFVGKYSVLRSGNGYKWPESLIGRYEFIREGRGDDWSIQLMGFCNKNQTRAIRKDIYESLINQKCEHSGYGDLSSDKLEVDHRNGRYNNPLVLNLETQKESDFMTLSRRANLQKREFCKKCKLTGKRFDAREFYFNVGWISGDELYSEVRGGCVGCYWYGPKEFRKKLILK